jgi:hypothetical protein
MRDFEGEERVVSVRWVKRFMRAAVLCCVLIGAASASASVVVVSPGGAVTGTAGASQISGFGARVVTCMGATRYTVTYGTGGTGVTLPYGIATNLQLAGTGCSITPGGINVTLACTATATASVTGASSAGVTPGTIRGIGCTITVTGSTCSVRVSGQVVSSHSDATSQLTIPTFGQSLVASGSTDGRGGSCSVLPNSAALTLTTDTGTALVFTESPVQRVIVA